MCWGLQDRPEVTLENLSESVDRKCGVSVGHKKQNKQTKTSINLIICPCIKHLPPLLSLKLFLSSQLSNIHLSFPLFPFLCPFNPPHGYIKSFWLLSRWWYINCLFDHGKEQIAPKSLCLVEHCMIRNENVFFLSFFFLRNTFENFCFGLPTSNRHVTHDTESWKLSKPDKQSQCLNCKYATLNNTSQNKCVDDSVEAQYCLQRCSVHLLNILRRPEARFTMHQCFTHFPTDNMPDSTRFNLFGRNSCLWTMLWKESRYALGIDISIFWVKNNGQKYSPNKPDSTSTWHFYNHFVGLSDRFAINQFGKRQFIILRAQFSHLWKAAITLSHH